MGRLLDPFTPINFPDLFTTMWVGSLLVVAGSVAVYNVAQRTYRRYQDQHAQSSHSAP